MTGHFNIYGLALRISSDHPLLYRTLAADLEHFRTSHPSPATREAQLRLTALPRLSESDGYPADLAPYREMIPQQSIRSDQTVLRYATSLITVVAHPRKRQVRAGILPEAQLLPDPAYHLCFTQPVSLWLKQRSLFFLHAGCVAEGSAGVLIVGHSHAGKSCMSISSVRKNFRFLSDEQPMLTRRGGSVVALAFPRRIRLDRAAASLFPELKRFLRASRADRIIFPIERVWPGSITETCLPRLLIFPRFQARGKLKVKRLHPTGALARLLEDDHFIWYRRRPYRRVSDEHLSLLEELVRQASSLEIRYGDSDLPRIPELFRKFLSGG